MKYTEKKLGDESVFLLQPETFMNRSGPAVRELMGYFGRDEALTAIDSSLLVVHDDLDLEEGKLRFRAQGSSGGHRGVQSVVEAFGSDAFGRLKIGVGRPSGSEAKDYVLAPLSGEAEAWMLQVCDEAAKTLPVWIHQGIQACANCFNGAAPGGKRTQDKTTKTPGEQA